MEWNAPFAGGWVPWYAKGVCAADVRDDGVEVGKCDIVAGGDNVVYADEGSAESVWDDRCLVGANVCHFFHGFCLHVAVPD